MAVRYFFKIVLKKSVAEDKGVKYYMFSENGHKIKMTIEKGEATLVVIRKDIKGNKPELRVRFSDIESITAIDCVNEV